MGICFVHGEECYIPGNEDDILLCESCIQELKKSALMFCNDCGYVGFVGLDLARELALGDNPEKPEAKEWFDKLPIMLVLYGCSECKAETEGAMQIAIHSGFRIENGKVFL